jgi:hypothetical protein
VLLVALIAALIAVLVIIRRRDRSWRPPAQLTATQLRELDQLAARRPPAPPSAPAEHSQRIGEALRRFLMRWAPGSPGSVARVMARSYCSIRKRHPRLGADEVMREVYLSRVGAYETWGSNVLPRQAADAIVQLARGSLLKLTSLLLAQEAPHLYGEHASIDAQSQWGDVEATIVAVLDWEAPGWRDLAY